MPNGNLIRQPNAALGRFLWVVDQDLMSSTRFLWAGCVL